MTQQSQPEPQLLNGQSGLPVANPTKSYWHKEPSAQLLGHRTTSELPRSADVAIVGSGITGAFAAHFLREKRPDLNIVMVEAREACWGATGRNGGHCQPAMYMPLPHIASFELRTFSFLKNLVEEYSIPCDWHSTSGVHAYYSAELFALARGKVAALTDKYPDLAANVAIVTKGEGGSPPWLLAGERKEFTLEGLRVPNAEGAIVQWNAASLWPYKLVAFVLERLLAANTDDSAEGKGGSFNLQTNTPVTGLTKTEAPPSYLRNPPDSRSHAKTTWTLHTPRGTLTAPQVLLATNAYTSHLLPSLADLLLPTRGQVSSLKPPSPSPSPSPSSRDTTTDTPPVDIGHTFYIMGEPTSTFSRDDYLIQRPPLTGGELVFGGGRQHARGRGLGVWDDSTIDEPVAWYLRGELGGVVDLSSSSSSSSSSPGPEGKGQHIRKQDLEPTHEWTGIMGYTRDGRPLVGRVPESLGGDDNSNNNGGGGDGLWLCAGYTGHGMPNAALCAKAVVDMMCAPAGDGGVEIDLPPEYELTPERVARARLVDEVAAVDAKGSLWADFGMEG
ncbi:FAD dependent oxidoreductase [Biscogniauxia marginata]|nr:FAD dependent oxidoreductase [Biscogniauxia marginata]